MMSTSTIFTIDIFKRIFRPLAPERQQVLVGRIATLVAVIAALPIAVAVALFLARRDVPGKWLFDGIVHLPLVLPPVVMGYLLLVVFGTNAPLGAWLNETIGLRFVFSWTGAALAAPDPKS